MEESTGRLLERAGATLRVAVVDNDYADRELVRRLFESIDEWSVSISCADSLASARALLRQEGPFDIVLLDYVLGMDNGLDLLRSPPPELRGASVVLMTGHGDQRIAVEALKLGACDYIDKSDLDANALRRSISLVLTTRKERLHLRAIERAACYDELTGVWRRWYFLDRCQDEIERSHRYGFPLALILLDLDHFKAVNDTHGHLAGDAVLGRVASLLRSGLRNIDMIGRYGGEEFCLLFPQTSHDRAVILADRLRGAIEKMRVTADPATIRITASFGVAPLMPGDAQAVDLIARADAALYQAKRSGRNRVVRI